jgi:hypothetical protein
VVAGTGNSKQAALLHTFVERHLATTF